MTEHRSNQSLRIMHTRCQLVIGTWALLLLSSPIAATGEPFRPQKDDQVLERVRPTALEPGVRSLKELRRQLTADPENLELASRFARACIERSRTEADPRYLGRAQTALAPWWNVPTAPVQALVLRATIRQSQHDFTNALADLELALAKDPRNAQAWLTKATILGVLGDYAQARRACIPLAQLAPGLLSLTCAASVACLNGEAEHGCALLRKALGSYPPANRAEKLWALTVLGEASARTGCTSEAEGWFKDALELAPGDCYTLYAYADLLLDQGRVAEVLDLLKDGLRSDGLLLRVALAESQLQPKPASLPAQVDSLRARFEEGHRRGDFVHQREEARFCLSLLGLPREALALAQANWRVQREPADARILLESALAAKDSAAAQPVLEFIRSNRVQDVRLMALAKQLE